MHKFRLTLKIFFFIPPHILLLGRTLQKFSRSKGFSDICFGETHYYMTSKKRVQVTLSMEHHYIFTPCSQVAGNIMLQQGSTCFLQPIFTRASKYVDLKRTQSCREITSLKKVSLWHLRLPNSYVHIWISKRKISWK